MTVAFPGYVAKNTERSFKLLRRAYNSLSLIAYDTVTYPYGIVKHHNLLKTSTRVSNHTYTCFFRAPTQLKTLTGPVLQFLRNHPADRLKILLFACSSGAEAYTIASWLRTSHPALKFQIQASDLHQELVDYASVGVYTRDEVYHSEYITEEFVKATFDIQDGRYVVKPEVKAHVTFQQANLLEDRCKLKERFDKASIVIAQNVLFHLPPNRAAEAFTNVLGLMRDKGVLMIEGMDLDLRLELTKMYGLEPLLANSRQIYQETRVHTPRDWWNYYWGTEPYTFVHPDRDRRYASIFTRSE